MQSSSAVRREIGQVESIGSRARQIFSGGLSGRVLAVVSTAAYLEGDTGEIIWLGQAAGAHDRAPLPRHPRALLGAFDLSSLEKGMNFAGSKTLRFSNGSWLDWRHAREWHAPTIRSTASAEQVADRAAELLDALSETHPRGNLAELLGPIRDSTRRPSVPAVELDSPFLSAALDPVFEIATSISRGDISGALRRGEKLIGLGAGLTPSGDDFLGGLLFVLYYLRSLYPESVILDTETLDALLDSARSRTNTISLSLLHDYARGVGPEPIYHVLASLLTLDPLQSLLHNAHRVSQIGLSSGWDTLAGFVTGLLSLRTL